MADRMENLPITPIRYAYKAPDGTIPYFSASSGQQSSGRLPEGTDPQALADNGYTLVDRETFVSAMRATDPKYRADQDDVDDLASAFDASMGTGEPHMSATQDTPSTPQAALTPGMLSTLQQYMKEGRLDELFQPYQQEQNVLDQQMQMAQGLRQQGPRGSTPMGALFSGISNAAGSTMGAYQQQQAMKGQTALGKRQQEDASGRMEAILREMQRRKGVDPNAGLMKPAVDDAELARMFSGGQ